MVDFRLFGFVGTNSVASEFLEIDAGSVTSGFSAILGWGSASWSELEAASDLISELLLEAGWETSGDVPVLLVGLSRLLFFLSLHLVMSSA